MSYTGVSLPNQSTQLHGRKVALSVHAGDHRLPPPGVFNWHYLQCVIKRFGAPQYRNYPDIRFFVFPFRTASDGSDDESGSDGDNDTNPPYPSYCFDRYLEKVSEGRRAQECRTEILQWVSGVPQDVQDVQDTGTRLA